jgi:hypothetical protein
MVLAHHVLMVVRRGDGLGISRLDFLAANIHGNVYMALEISVVLFEHVFSLRGAGGIRFYRFVDRYRYLKKAFAHEMVILEFKFRDCEGRKHILLFQP